MKTYNTKYTNIELLKNFIFTYQIDEADEVLIQIFTGIIDKQYIQSLIEQILTIIPQAKIIGSTTSGEILEETSYEKSTILSFSIFTKTTIKTHYQSYETTSSDMADNLYKQFTNPQDIKLMLSFTEGMGVNGEKFIKRFKEHKEQFIIAGGLAGDNAEFKRTYVFDNNGCYDNGVVCALFYSNELYINTINSFGWKPIGKKLKVTKAKDNIVYSIDGISAVDIYKKYLGDDVANQLPNTGIEFPLIINRNDIEIARAVVGIDKKNKALIFAGNVEEGNIVQFGYGDIDTIKLLIETTNKKLVQKPIESIFIYSCMARKQLMNKSIESELLPISKLAPTSGFFTYGELFTKQNNYELLNETMTILAISENSNKIASATNYNLNKTKNKTINALTHLVSVATNELTELNRTLEEKVLYELQKNREKDKQLLFQNRLAQMGEMISMIAHQWRQPLSSIGSATSNIKLKATLGTLEADSTIELCDMILTSTKYLSSTIDDFRNFYKKDKQTSVTTFKEMLDNVIKIVNISLSNNNIDIKIDIKNEDEILTYPNEVKQVIINIIKNAKDVLVEKNISKPTIEITVYKEHYYHIMTIKDNGGGIADETMDYIFDPYFSTKKLKDGTGLGLYMSKIIIENNCHGKLSAYNEDNGAVFKIALPDEKNN